MERFFSQQNIERYRKLLDISTDEPQRRMIFQPMQHTARTGSVRPSDNNHLAELMKLFGCAGLIAPWDTETFGNRMGELVRRAVSAPKKALLEIKARLEAEDAAETERSSRSALLNMLQNAPRSDRLAMLAAAAASRSPIKVLEISKCPPPFNTR